MLLRQIWTSSPFWGILGAGQGAAVASMFLSLLLLSSFNSDDENEIGVDGGSSALSDSCPSQNAFGNKCVLTPPQFAIFCSGQSLVQIDDDDNNITAGGFPVLHLVDRCSTVSQESLIRQFGGTVKHRKATCADDDDNNIRSRNFDNHDLNIIGRFICEQKQRLFSSSSSSSHNCEEVSSCSIRQEIVTLQTALHIAEQQASDAIAQHIAQHPPAALMAVIRPQAVVAGWQGGKRRQPGEEGGGAPCPIEFVLHRNQRSASTMPTTTNSSSTASDGGSASRVHPQTRQQQNDFHKDDKS
jgi:hypothetical protein